MRALLRTDVRVDLVNSVVDLAELVKLASKFGLHVEMTAPPSHDNHGYRARLFSETPTWLEREIAFLLLLLSMSTGRSVDDALANLRRRLEGMHVAMDKPLSDVAGIGDASTQAEG